MAPIRGFAVGYTPVPTANLLATRKRGVVGRVISLIITLGFNALFWWLTRNQEGDWRWWIIGVTTGLSVLYVVIAIIQVWRASRALQKIGSGVALDINRHGLWWDPQGENATFISLSDIAFIGTKGRAPVPGTNLAIETTSGARYRVPLMYLDALPGTLDGALRAYSGGAVLLDVSSLDALLSPGAARTSEL